MKNEMTLWELWYLSDQSKLNLAEQLSYRKEIINSGDN